MNVETSDSHMRRKLANLFGIDPRSLAAFRMGLGLLILVDLAIRATALAAHYTDAGIMPRDLVLAQFPGQWRWSLHWLSDGVAFQSALFLLAAVAAICLLIGYHTRVATCISWILMVSLHTRSPYVLNGGDVFLRLLLLWSMFLPLEIMWSIDRRRQKKSSASLVLSLGTVGILVQICLVYWMTAYFKLHGAWLKPNTLSEILQYDSYARPFAYTLHQYPQLLTLLGFGVVAVELIGPLIVFCPVFTKAIRCVVVAAIFLMHLGIELTLTVGLFSYVSWLAWILFVPDTFWNAFGQRQVVWDEIPMDMTTVAPRSTTKRYLYFFHAILAGLLLVYVVLWNISTTKFGIAQRAIPAWSRPLANVLMLKQKWSMFTSPPSRDGWYVVMARLKDGQVIDLLRKGAPADFNSFDKPTYISRRFPNHRWRKFYRELVNERLEPFRAPLCHYLANNWNESHPEEESIFQVELNYMEELEGAEDNDRFMQRFLHTAVIEPNG